MNKFTALDRVNALYSAIYTSQYLNINNTTLSSSVLLYIKQSGVVLKIDDENEISPNKDSVFYLDKGSVVTIQAKKNSSYDIYYFSVREVKEVYYILCSLNFNATNGIIERNGYQHPAKENYLHLEADEGDFSIFRKLHANISISKKAHILLYFLSGYSTSSLVHFFKKNITFSFSERIKSIIEEDLAAPWKITDISQRMYISESSIRKKLLQENQTFNNLLLDVRMHAAAKMILTTEKHINVIAQSVGYTSPSYFIKAFKDYFEITPKQLSLKIRGISSAK